ncbi:hypothetical protein GYMLUDRAFT_241073 [Collybiopsis luxurians FD-317 M1]|nr:hypothetical protein GYMLUDRAFT_241073 [Collybiopsis luxurians FD-317 M1]
MKGPLAWSSTWLAADEGISIVRQLPPVDTPQTAKIFILNGDALEEIFRACVALEAFTNPTDTLANTSRAPWVLGEVCRSWRRIILSSPLLWTFFGIRVDKTLCSDHRMLFMLDTYLSRSASCPLDIHIHSETCFQETPPFLSYLFSTSRRWRSLSINIPLSSCHSLSPLTGSLNSLELLRIDYPFQSQAQIRQDFYNLTEEIRIFRYCTNLKRLSLRDISFPRDIFDLPWAKIQNLDFNKSLSSNLASNSGVFNSLQGLQNLTSCILKCRASVLSKRKADRLTLPLLHSMTLISADETPHINTDSQSMNTRNEAITTGVPQMLSWLILPALQHLVLKHKHPKETELSLVEVIQLVNRSRCEIREFHLSPSIGYLIDRVSILGHGRLSDPSQSPALSDETILKAGWPGKNDI